MPSSHTPGPWVVSGRGDAIAVDNDRRFPVVARVTFPLGAVGLHLSNAIPDRETAAANARLLAAAPELLAALEALSTAVCEAGIDNDYVIPQRLAAAVDATYEVLRKVRGAQ